jgi:multiple sugar transport system ATP-binding protein
LADIRFEGVHKLFGDEVAVADLNLEIADGEFLVLVGSSGCGKTTTLRMLAGFERPTYGRIWVGGEVVNTVPPKQRDIAMVFQSYALFPHMTVRQNLTFGPKVRREPREATQRRVEEVAEMLGLTPLLARKPAALSGGQRQRVALGRALLRHPKAFLMDEPLSNLDAALRVQMRTELAHLHERFGVTTVYVTHDQVEAMTMGDRIAVMSEGRLQQVDSPEALYDNPANLFVATFIGAPKMNVVSGTLTTGSDGTPAVDCLDLSIPVDAARLSAPGGAEVSVGIRPEDIGPSSAADAPALAVSAEVDLVEPMGHEVFVRVRIGDEELVSRFPPRSGVKPHDHVELVVDAGRIHVFERVSGRSLLSPTIGATPPKPPSPLKA